MKKSFNILKISLAFTGVGTLAIATSFIIDCVCSKIGKLNPQ